MLGFYFPHSPDDRRRSANGGFPKTGILGGYVMDLESRRGIPDARVKILIEGGAREDERSTTTDRGGAFRFPALPVGVYTGFFEREGYAPKTMTGIRITSDVPVRLDVDLVRLPQAIREEVTVVAEAVQENARRTAGAVTIEGERLRKTPGSMDDVSRVIRTSAGLSQVNDLSNELIVRGGSPWENAFYHQPDPFYDINHFQAQGGSGGLIGLINASWVRSMSFYKGGFPAAFGDRMSSVIEMAFREGDGNGFAAKWISTLPDSAAAWKARFSDGRGSFLLSAKRSYHDILAKIIGVGVAPRFGDIHFKAAVDFGPRHRLVLLDVNGDSRMAFDLERAVTLGFTRSLNYVTRQNTVGLTWYAGWSDVYSSVTSLAWSAYRNTDELEDSVSKDALFLIDEMTDVLNLRHVGSLRLGPRSKASFGFESRLEVYDFNNTYGETVNPYAQIIPQFVRRGDLRTTKAAAFANLDWTPSGPLTVSLGARLDHFSFNRSTEISPRLTVAWAVVPRFAVKAGAGLFRQAVPTAILGVSPEARTNRNPYAVHRPVRRRP